MEARLNVIVHANANRAIIATLLRPGGIGSNEAVRATAAVEFGTIRLPQSRGEAAILPNRAHKKSGARRRRF
jgi:hypothetical protein